MQHLNSQEAIDEYMSSSRKLCRTLSMATDATDSPGDAPGSLPELLEDGDPDDNLESFKEWLSRASISEAEPGSGAAASMANASQAPAPQALNRGTTSPVSATTPAESHADESPAGTAAIPNPSAAATAAPACPRKCAACKMMPCSSSQNSTVFWDVF